MRFRPRFSLLRRMVFVAVLGVMVGCASPAFKRHGMSGLADQRGAFVYDTELPAGFSPLVGLDANSPNDYIDGWPRYIVCNADNSVMVYVPGGQYRMGTGDPSQGPTGRVDVAAFYVDVYEITNFQFARFVHKKKGKSLKQTSGTRALGLYKGDDHDVTNAFAEYWVPNVNNDDPVRNVSWWEALHYATWAGKMLPTEAQWELAARGTRDHRRFPWGDAVDNANRLCNYENGGDIYDGHTFAAPVAAYPGGASPYGAMNMSGNVWEWCADWYDATGGMRRRFLPWRDPSSVDPQEYPGGNLPLAAGPDGPVPDADAVEINPVGPLYGSQRVIRGGAFTSNLDGCQVTVRAGVRPDARQTNVGFRCILPLD